MRLLFYKHLFSCIYLLKTDSYTVYIFRSPAHRRSVQSLFYPKIAIIIRRGLYLCKLHVYSRSDRVDPIIEISNVYITCWWMFASKHLWNVSYYKRWIQALVTLYKSWHILFFLYSRWLPILCTHVSHVWLLEFSISFNLQRTAISFQYLRCVMEDLYFHLACMIACTVFTWMPFYCN